MTNEPFQLGEGSVKVEDGIPLLQRLSLLLGGRQHHGTVGTVDFEEDGVLRSDAVVEGGLVGQLGVLVVREVVLFRWRIKPGRGGVIIMRK